MSNPPVALEFPYHLASQAEAITVIGIELRTTNEEAMQTIPPLWQRFTQEGVLASLPGKLGDDVFAVYTHFEHAGLNNTGSVYSTNYRSFLKIREKIQAQYSSRFIQKSRMFIR